MTRAPFPLQWPESFKRTPADQRTRSRFGFRGSGQVPLGAARDELIREIDRLGGANCVLTSDLPVNRQGLPYASVRAHDPGIAVWFILDDQERVFACDRWLSHAENMQAIAKSVEAMRGLDRWGMADVVARVMGGFSALPPGDGTEYAAPPPRKRTWREVIGGEWPPLDSVELLAIAKMRHREAIKTAHPDAGGSHELAAELNAALAEAEQELAAP